MSLELAPESETRLREYAEAEGVSINELIAKYFPARTAEQSTHERIQGLLTKWQKEYGMPTPPGGFRHSLTDLFDEWEAEDANMTPEQVEEERRFWAEYEQREREYISL